MNNQTKWSKLRLKTVFNLTFICFIVVPILIVLIGVLNILNRQFKTQAIENISRAQETIMTELSSDIKTMSMRLSHLVHGNNSEVLDYAAGTNTNDLEERNIYQNKLNQAGGLVLEPVSDILSVGFYMKDGRASFYKNSINWPYEKIKNTKWYQTALQGNNQVIVGWITSERRNELYSGSKQDHLILVFALAPDRKTDRSERIEVIALYQVSRTGDKMKNYNKEYLSGKNKLGFMQLCSADGEVIFSTMTDQETLLKPTYTCVQTPVKLYGDTWYIESYIPTKELTSEFWKTAKYVLLVAIGMLLLVGYCSRYFIRSMVAPIEKINTGLRQVEEGELAIHITPEGQYEIRTMIHSFNAMVRRLQALISEYEEKMQRVEKSMETYFEELMTGNITPKEVMQQSKYFFEESYAILYFALNDSKGKEIGKIEIEKVKHCFMRNPRFSARCTVYVEDNMHMYAFYLITEENYLEGTYQMISALQKVAKAEFGIEMDVCIGKKVFGQEAFYMQVAEVKEKLLYRYLKGKQVMFSLEDSLVNTIMSLVPQYEAFATAIYVADERNILKEKEKLFSAINTINKTGKETMEEARWQVLAVILALAKKFEEAQANFHEVFGEAVPYEIKLARIQDIKSLKLWMTNYIEWLIDYEAGKLGEKETDTISKAKHYISSYYENADLSLGQVAEYVGLNEKYFTSKFSKETGESFMNYLTGLRMQKAKELLKTTTFKIYEIAEMVGYRNVESFNRVFKKYYGISPLQYRKTM